tara:strand:- start:7385 stop:8194 length:810 start_codon:yes stop_codon:yes gene_type:complete
MAALFGLPLQQIIGQSQEDILHEAYSRNTGINIGSDSVHDWLKEIKKNQRNLQENEFVLSSTDGDVFKLYRVKVSSGEHIVIGTKITELIETQKQLKGTLKKLDELAKTCELTGLPNRRHILECLEKEFYRAKRYSSMFAVIIADIDHFKKVNDTYGHSVGDETIIHFSKLVKDNLRETDMVGRIGGEEFVIVLPNTDQVNATILANRIRESVANCPLPLESNQPLRVTSSFGVSQFLTSDEDKSEVVKRADEALYIAKNSGRNKVHSY